MQSHSPRRLTECSQDSSGFVGYLIGAFDENININAAHSLNKVHRLLVTKRVLVKNCFPVVTLAVLLGKVTVVTPTLAPQRCERMRVFVENTHIPVSQLGTTAGRSCVVPTKHECHIDDHQSFVYQSKRRRTL